MYKRKIKVDLSNINKAIKEVTEVKKQFLEMEKRLHSVVSNRAEILIRAGFQMSVRGDYIANKEGYIPPNSSDVTVKSIHRDRSLTYIVASGEDAVFIEFGAGVTHNTPVGTSPHPLGGELGMTIGSYGKGRGGRKVWGYRDEAGNLVLTRGTPATQPMYRAVSEILDELSGIVSEVFIR